jgi:hypothetical protein
MVFFEGGWVGVVYCTAVVRAKRKNIPKGGDESKNNNFG